MPALTKTTHVGEIAWLGVVADRNASLRTDPRTSIPATFSGFEGEAHGGLTRPACSRTTQQYPRGTEIRNVRQLTILSQEDLAAIAAKMNLSHLDPALLGASMVVRGIPDFTHVPPSSRLQAASGATFTVDMENRPCIYPGQTIEEDRPGHGKAFKAAANGRRGVTAWVEREGLVSVGDAITLHIPDQRAWTPV